MTTTTTTTTTTKTNLFNGAHKNNIITSTRNGQKHSHDDKAKFSLSGDSDCGAEESDDCLSSTTTSTFLPTNMLQTPTAMPLHTASAAISPLSPTTSLEGHYVSSSLSSPRPEIMTSIIMNRRRCRPTTSAKVSALNYKPPPLPASPVRIALDMRTRSSRLFFVLLHLVGVSTNVPSSSSSSSHASTTQSSSSWFTTSSSSFFWSSYSYGGIVGVQPSAILLERLDIQSSRRGLKGIIDRVERVHNWDADIDLLGEPYWFQDNTDGLCLGPGGGFSECGDATLWRIRRRPLTKRQVLREKRENALRQERWRREQQLQNERSSTKITKDDHSMRYHQEGGEPSSTSTTTTTMTSSSSSSSVCVWPFFCDRNSQVSQPSHVEYYDEVYGFAYHENRHSTHDDYETDDGFALQLTDIDAMTANASFSRHNRRGYGKRGGRRRQKRGFFWTSNQYPQSSIDPQDDCLLSIILSNNNGVGDGGASLEIGPCSSEEAFVWHVNRDGVLVRKATKAERRRRNRGRWNLSPKRASSFAVGGGSVSSQTDFGCVHRTNSTFATVMPCDDVGNSLQPSDGDSVVQFSLVRYPSTSSKILPSRRGLFEDDYNNDAIHTSAWEPWTSLVATSDLANDNCSHNQPTDADGHSVMFEQNFMPTSRTSSQHHASAGTKHRKKVDLKSTASMLHASLEQGRTKPDVDTSASHIRFAPIAMNGVAFHNQRMSKDNNDEIDLEGTMKRHQTSSGSSSKSPRMSKSSSSTGQTPIHDKSFESRGGVGGGQHSVQVDSNSPHRPRKIPVHPYIQSSSDFVWVDPLTSLEYPTDLCQYLGQTKKEAGRHTLMGVGQYYRTAFNIKVYGAALYVAKRDVLADPKFGEYATLSSEELRNRGDFYDLLMNMPSPGEDPANSIGGLFDRTLFVKINMQLSLEAMRKSLEADWSLLTDEMKSLIINSSFKERVADERMQQKILSKENSSNCSCGQVAPPEFKADPSCCARGTELVFTWRKNGDFEIRLDGRVVDIFPRPDIAKGIFSEYMNDDPISRDAKAHFTDGFPFLLAPLAQVKGMTSAVPHTQEQTREVTSSSTNPMRRLMGVAMHSMDSMNSQAHSLSKWVLDSAVGVSSNAMGSAMGVARGLSEELDRQRLEFFENAVALQKDGLDMLSSLVKLSVVGDALALTIANQGASTLSPFSNGYETYYQEREIVTDEIGIKIGPTMNFTHRLFFTTVHIYLLLLLIVSLPGSNSTRLVVKRRI